jgi:hypothetical protein
MLCVGNLEYEFRLSSFSWGRCPLLPRGKIGIRLSRLPNPFPHCP